MLLTLLGDASAINDLNQASILQLFDQYVNIGEDIICDLREKNGGVPKYDELWNIVDAYIQNKSATDDDQQHGSKVNVEIIVTMTIGTSCADFYRQYVTIVTSKSPLVEAPSKQWFMIHF